MCQKLEIILPLPDGRLNPNRRRSLHWGTASRLSQLYKQQCFVAARNALQKHQEWKPPAKAKMTLTFCHHLDRGRDIDNSLSSFKSGLDGIVQAGVLEDDNGDCLEHGSHCFHSVLAPVDEKVIAVIERLQ